MFDGIHYAIQFKDGEYYTGSNYGSLDLRTSKDIKDATLYKLKLHIHKDLYFQSFIFGKDIDYKIVKIVIEVTYRLSED